MSVSTNFIALKDKDKIFQNHKKVLIACKRAKVSLPKETAEYCGSDDWELAEENISEKLEVELIEGKHYNEILTESENGFEVLIKKLPKEVTKIRFTNSW
jgi:hypothetical protein